MKKELKIIAGSEPHTTKVFVDDKPIKLIQKITFIAEAQNVFNNVEIVFPDLMSIPSYPDNNGLLATLKENIELLKDMSNVKITLEKLVFEDS